MKFKNLSLAINGTLIFLLISFTSSAIAETSEVKIGQPVFLHRNEATEPTEEFKRFMLQTIRLHWTIDNFYRYPTAYADSVLGSAKRIDKQTVRLKIFFRSSVYDLDVKYATSVAADRFWLLLIGAPTYFMIPTLQESIRVGTNTILTAIPFSGSHQLDYKIEGKHIEYWDFDKGGPRRVEGN